MLPQRYALFINPHAGRGAASRVGALVAHLLAAAGRVCEVIVSSTAEAACAQARALPDQVAVVAVGGDGTLSALLPAVVGNGRYFGAVPAGRGNDLAYALKWRGTTPEEVAARLQREPRAIDVLRVRINTGGRLLERFSLNGLGMGLDARVTAFAARVPTSFGGFGQYAVGTLLALYELRTPQLQVSVDGEGVFSGLSFLVAVMNGTRYGGGFHISPESILTDGLADVLIGSRVGHLGLLPLIGRVLLGRHLRHPKVGYHRGRRIVLRWEEATPLHVDGDLYGPVKEVETEVVPGGVLMLGA
jgi:diacylglycerol kinase (ATP)